MRPRAAGVTSAQAPCMASWAARTAASTSSAPPRATSAIGSSNDGSMVVKRWPEAAGHGPAGDEQIGLHDGHALMLPALMPWMK